MNEIQDTINCPECKHDIHIVCMEKALKHKKQCVLCRSHKWEYYKTSNIDSNKFIFNLVK